MKKCVTKLALLVWVFTFSGCSLGRLGMAGYELAHWQAPPEEMTLLYYASRADLALVTASWTMKCQPGEFCMVPPRSISPLFLFDLPIALVVDTVLLPSDLLIKIHWRIRNNQAVAFWEQSFEHNKLPDLNDRSVRHYCTSKSAQYINQQLDQNKVISSCLLDMIYYYCGSYSMGSIVVSNYEKVLHHRNVSKETLLRAERTKTCHANIKDCKVPLIAAAPLPELCATSQ